jgi:hypothetical protein
MDVSSWIAILLFIVLGSQVFSLQTMLLAPAIFLAIMFVCSLPVLAMIAWNKGLPWRHFWRLVIKAWTPQFRRQNS